MGEDFRRTQQEHDVDFWRIEDLNPKLREDSVGARLVVACHQAIFGRSLLTELPTDSEKSVRRCNSFKQRIGKDGFGGVDEKVRGQGVSKDETTGAEHIHLTNVAQIGYAWFQ